MESLRSEGQAVAEVRFIAGRQDGNESVDGHPPARGLHGPARNLPVLGHREMSPQPRDAQRQRNDLGPVVALDGAASPAIVGQSNSALDVRDLRVPLGRPDGGDRRLQLKGLAENLGQTDLRIGW